MELKDLQGEKIEVGDEIAYAILTGRSATLATYKVLEITEQGKMKAQQLVRGHNYYHRPASRVSTLAFASDRAVVTKKWSEQ